MKMTTVTVSENQKCDFCNHKYPTVYDGPTLRGPWAHACEACSTNLRYKKTKLTVGEQVEPKGGEPLLAKTVGDPEELMFESVRQVECPECHVERSMEMDAEGEFDCEGCGQRLRCVDIMEEMA